jgi:hypothetical protein
MASNPGHLHAHLLGGVDCRNRSVLCGHAMLQLEGQQQHGTAPAGDLQSAERLHPERTAGGRPGTAGVGITGIGAAALACGVVFIAARQIGSNLSEEDGFALTRTIGIGVVALLVAVVGQFVFAIFGGGVPQFLDIAISGFGVLIFVGAAVVDFSFCPAATKTNSICRQRCRCISPTSTCLCSFCGC